MHAKQGDGHYLARFKRMHRAPAPDQGRLKGDTPWIRVRYLVCQLSIDNKQCAQLYSLILPILLVRLFLGECSGGRKPVFA